MDKNLILAFVLAFLVLVSYNILVTRSVKTPPQPQVAREVVTTNEDTHIKERAVRQDEMAVAIPFTTSEVQQEFEENEIMVETPLFRGVITNQGGGIKSWELKSYKDTIEEDSPLVNMLPSKGLKRYPFEVSIIDTSSGSEERFDLSPSRDAINLEKGEREELILSGISQKGIAVEERLIFSGDSYTVDIEINVINSSSEPFNGMLSMNLFGLMENIKKTGRYGHIGPISYINGEVQREKIKDIEKGKEYNGTILWAGIEDKYFLSSLLPVAPEGVELKIGVISNKTIISKLLSPAKTLSPQESGTYKFKAYIGPREIELLKEAGGHLEEVIGFGYFTVIAKPLLVALKFFYSFLSNYGLAIILLTVLIKVVFYPLTKHSLTSMKEMQKVQPQLTALKKKYANDKERMNKELMELYKRNKVNPLGGCLPMILQIPVFIALYNILYTSIELRHAPFIFWIQDLSAKDPYYISPLLMGASMIVQQRMSPSAMDSQQAKMMMFMPVFFTFLFLKFPAGLVIYWLVNNLLQIGQQYYIQKKS